VVSLLQADNLVVGYGQADVLRGLALHVDDGECLGLFGPNGHGKTTLLRTISGLLSPRSGAILYRERPMAGLDARRIVEAGIIHVPQGNTMFPGLTVLENLKMGAYPTRARADEAGRLRRTLELFPILGERRNQLSRTLSGGERQMLAIGIGLMGNPVVLMLDEPTLGLAPKIKQVLFDAVGEIAQSGITLLLVDQDVEFLLGLANRLCLVEQGVVAFETRPGDALDDRSIMAMYFGGRAASNAAAHGDRAPIAEGPPP
jgi:branched-chain amino acid transport system ATP-binding protein